MNFRLLSLKSTGPETCEALIRREPDREELRTVFRVTDVEGIQLVNSEPDVFRTFDGSAQEQRELCAAVVAFCKVAEQ